ncbi:hypothetical protein D9V37_10935 [Nocardioides mangrovicus]|uniref:Uncharacterized protein n=1 Tax=Nocardioides mangrovicus TaxID=2478913 RepID=A0A3L8P204_9ACTN|nr:hypothetical protein [Nocardioides mangrovicus]RLV49081.1 hypothetical protein D9V37_10935 [Nocardioides mangrovicus]
MRYVVGAVGVLAGLYGAWELLRVGLANLLAAVWWLAGGVIVHDGFVGPALLVAAVVVMAVVPSRVRGPVVAGLVVLGTVTVTAVPVLTRFGARADNPTLLDRNYTVGWLVFAVLVVAATGVGVARRLREPAAADGVDVVREPHDER